MTGLYNNAGLPLYSPTTHLLRFCSIPAAYKRRITQKERKDDGFERFITPSVPFAERRIIIMEIYGYEKNGEDLLKLKEASILCSIKELESIIDFLQDIKKEHERYIDATEMNHAHYRDWDKNWKKGSPDFIIVTKG